MTFQLKTIEQYQSSIEHHERQIRGLRTLGSSSDPESVKLSIDAHSRGITNAQNAIRFLEGGTDKLIEQRLESQTEAGVYNTAINAFKGSGVLIDKGFVVAIREPDGSIIMDEALISARIFGDTDLDGNVETIQTLTFEEPTIEEVDFDGNVEIVQTFSDHSAQVVQPQQNNNMLPLILLLGASIL